MLFPDLKRSAALALTTVLISSVAATAAPSKPGSTRLMPPAHSNATGTQQVLNEGGTLAALFFGNIMDVFGAPIFVSPGIYRDNAAELDIPKVARTNPQYNYAPTGTGTAQADFVAEKSGFKGKNIAQAYPYTQDGLDNWQNFNSGTGPYGFSPWAGTAASSQVSDSIHFAAGDAPLPLGDPTSITYNNNGLVYANSLATYNSVTVPGNVTPPGIGSSGDTPGGFNTSRGAAIVVPVIGTGVSVIFNTTGLSSTFLSSPKLTQNDICGIFTGQITNWNQTSANPANQTISIVHRSDGSGTTFLFTNTLSQLCSANNPDTGKPGYPTSATYWGAYGQAQNANSLFPNGVTQGVGTDSNNYNNSSTNNGIPYDTGAPQVVWPYLSIGESGSQGVADCINGKDDSGTNQPCGAGAVGYVSPSYVTGLTFGKEALVQNLNGDYAPANSATVALSLAGSEGGGRVTPVGYPVFDAFYFPFPLAAGGAPIVGYSYGYFYQCSNPRLASQVNGIKNLFRNVEHLDGTGGQTKSDAIALFWSLNPLPDSVKTTTLQATNGLFAFPKKSLTYNNPVTGGTSTGSCSAN